MATPPVHNNSISQSFLGKMKHTSLFIFSALFIAFASGCKKEESNIGANLVPDGDKLNIGAYEIPLQFKTIYEDTLATTKLSTIQLGSFNHPVFGSSSASVAAEFKLLNTVDFGPNPVIDSVVVSLNYLAANNYMPYGDITKLGGAQRVKVYELTEELNSDSTYYSGRVPQYNNAVLLGEKVFVPDYKNGYSFPQGEDTITESAQLRIKLNAAGLSKFQSLMSNSAFSNVDNFYTFFKGLYITPDNGYQSSNQGAGLMFSATERNCRIRIFYRNDASTTASPYQYAELVTLGDTRRYQVYTHNYSGTEVASGIALGTAAQKLYLQGWGGVKTKIILPDFDTIAAFAPPGSYVVNLAELVVPVEENSISTTFLPAQQILVAAPSVDSKYEGVENPPNTLIDDAIKIPSSYYGGTYDKDKKEYVFRISLHMANILNKIIENKGLYLVANQAFLYAQGTVISNTADRKIRLRVTYTKI